MFTDKIVFPSLLAAGLFLVLLIVSLKKIRYYLIYNTVILITAAIPILTLFIDHQFKDETTNKTLLVFLAAFCFLFVPTVMLMSIYNLVMRQKIHWLISVIGIIMGVVFLFVAMMIQKMSGVRMIG